MTALGARFGLGRVAAAAAAGLCLFLLCACDARPAAYDAAAWLSDYAALKRGLETSYANLAWFASPQGGVDLPALDRTTAQALAAARTDREAQKAISDFLKALPDAHLQLVDRRAADEMAAQDGGPRHIRLRGDPCAQYDLGDGLRTDFSLPFAKIAGVSRLPRRDSPFEAAIYQTDDGLRLGLVRIPSFELRQFADLCHGAAAEVRRDPADAIGDFDRFVEAGFLMFMGETLKDLKAHGAKAVLVDLGGNPGGGDVAQDMAALFAAAPLRSEALWMVAGPPAADWLDHEAETLRAARDHASDDPVALRDLSSALAQVAERKAALPARACDMSWVWRERRPWNPAGCTNLVDAGFAAGPNELADAHAYRQLSSAAALYRPAAMAELQGTWTGPLFVAVDDDTASAAELFGALLQDNGRAKLIGRRTAGAGCGNQGPYRFLALPHADRRLRVSDCVLLRADGSNEVAGLTPDLPVEGGSELARARATLEKAAAELRAASGRDTARPSS